MSTIAEEPMVPPRKLFPHQSDFVDTVLNPASKRIICLGANVGLGKSLTLATLASRFLQAHPAARVLILCPAGALCDHMREIIHEQGTRAVHVNRYKFREFLDNTTESQIWPCGFALLMSYEFARQPDVRDSLVNTQWDLLITDEAHLFTGARGDLFRRLESVADKVVLATASKIQVKLLSKLDVFHVEWKREQLVGHNGKLLDDGMRPLVHEVSFSLDREEKKLSAIVAELSQDLKAGTSSQRFISKILLQSFYSSPAALEGFLRRALERATLRDDFFTLMEDTDEYSVEASSSELPDQIVDEKVRATMGQALLELEDLQRDSKLDAFSQLLDRIKKTSQQDSRVCVITEYVDTLYYLAADLEERGLEHLALHGGVRDEEREKSFRRFVDTGGIIVATMAFMTEGLGLPEVTDLIFYDLPTNNLLMQKLLGRFDRFGRSKQLHVYLLTDTDNRERCHFESLGLPERTR